MLGPCLSPHIGPCLTWLFGSTPAKPSRIFQDVRARSTQQIQAICRKAQPCDQKMQLNPDSPNWSTWGSALRWPQIVSRFDALCFINDRWRTGMPLHHFTAALIYSRCLNYLFLVSRVLCCFFQSNFQMSSQIWLWDCKTGTRLN